VLRNERLDESWISHLERDQVTNLTVDTYVVVDPDAAGVLGETVPAFRIDSDELDYETVIETDVFGTKASDGLDPRAGNDGDRPAETPTPTPAGTHTATPSGPNTPTPAGTDAPTASPTSTPTPAPTSTATAGSSSS
jgi:cell division septation protein DedD